jgi:xanthine dehydrogenase YagS FAD-binding subunit
MRTFDFDRTTTTDQALKAGQSERAMYLAGGTTLLDLVKLDVMQPERLVDINRLELNRIERQSDGRVRIGALVTNTTLARDGHIIEAYPVLSQALLSGATTQLRNKATTAGNMMQRVRCHYFRDNVSPCNKREPGSGCSAIDGDNRSVHAVLGTSEHCIATHPSDMCVAMAAIGATVHVRGPKGEREIDFLDFHLLPGNTPEREHALVAGELITHITLAAPLANSRSGYLKLRDRASYQFALASSAVILQMQGDRIAEARVALGGVGTKPWRAREAEDALRGQQANDDTFRRVAQLALQSAKPYRQNAYKIPLAQQAIVRNLQTLTGGVA